MKNLIVTPFAALALSYLMAGCTIHTHEGPAHFAGYSPAPPPPPAAYSPVPAAPAPYSPATAKPTPIPANPAPAPVAHRPAEPPRPMPTATPAPAHAPRPVPTPAPATAHAPRPSPNATPTKPGSSVTPIVPTAPAATPPKRDEKKPGTYIEVYDANGRPDTLPKRSRR